MLYMARSMNSQPSANALMSTTAARELCLSSSANPGSCERPLLLTRGLGLPPRLRIFMHLQGVGLPMTRMRRRLLVPTGGMRGGRAWIWGHFMMFR